MTYGSFPLKRKIFNSGLWTQGKFDAFITSILRAGSRKWGPKHQALNAAKTEKKINVRTGRMAQHFECAACYEEFVATEVQVDHIIPMGTGRTWDDFINELYCEVDNLQVLCKGCHSVKTKLERKDIKHD